MARRGFTIVELLTVIAMIAILAAILFPVFAKAREAARTQTCRSNLFNIGMALRMYAVEHGGKYPPKEDDLSPLLGRYLLQQQVFVCPTSPGGVPMGAPADRSIPLSSTDEPPPMGPHRPEAPPGGVPGMPPGMTPPPPGLGPLVTSYYYRAGRKHNQLPRAPLVSDQEPRHNDDRANVLFSDGSIQTLLTAQWRALGFRPLSEIGAERAPKPSGPPGMPGMPGMPRPGMKGGGGVE
jgi:prepilin-type N-terminal cleavage/methylation domain-containing protein/prepilin-type processing-associated H-X9-DG protein